MDFFLPELDVNMVVTTPYTTLEDITPNKKYIIYRMERDLIWIRNDIDEIVAYKAIHFIEADVFFALCLYMTVMRTLGLTNKPLDSFKN